jgi:hypothetical protein
MMTFDVFISYSKHDKAVADAACTALEAARIRCWIAPRDIVPGEDWGASIVDAIDSCRAMVLIFSGHANESPQIRNEVTRAVSKSVPIIPLRIENIEPTKTLAYYMGAVHWLDALTPPLEAHLKGLTAAVAALLKIEPPPAGATSERLKEIPIATQTTPVMERGPAAAETTRNGDGDMTAALSKLSQDAAAVFTVPPPSRSLLQPWFRRRNLLLPGLMLGLTVFVAIGLYLSLAGNRQISTVQNPHQHRNLFHRRRSHLQLQVRLRAPGATTAPL